MDSLLAVVWVCVKAINFPLCCPVSFQLPGEGAFLLCSVKWQSKKWPGRCSTADAGGELLCALGRLIYSLDALGFAACALGTAGTVWPDVTQVHSFRQV